MITIDEARGTALLDRLEQHLHVENISLEDGARTRLAALVDRLLSEDTKPERLLAMWDQQLMTYVGRFVERANAVRPASGFDADVGATLEWDDIQHVFAGCALCPGMAIVD